MTKKIKLNFLKSVFVIGFLFLSVPGFGAGGFKTVNVGGQASFLTPPYPSLIGVSAQVTLLDMLRLQGDFGAGQFILGRLFGVKTASWGATALVRIPTLSISPIAGISISKNYVNEESSIFHSKNRLGTTRAQYLTPFAGVEFKPVEKVYFGFGLGLPLRKTNGTWKTQDFDAENTITGKVSHFSVVPFGYVGLFLF